MGKYIQYNVAARQYVRIRGKRPNNQGEPVVLGKIKKRLDDEVKGSEKQLTPIQQTFSDGVARDTKEHYKRSEDKIDIAHNVAIKPIVETMVWIMNSSTPAHGETLEHFFDAILSTDAKSDKKIDMSGVLESYRAKIEAFIAKVHAKQTSPEALCKEADEIIDKLNKSSRNLYSGGLSENRRISSRLDTPYLHDAKDSEKVHTFAKAERITTTFRAIPGNENYAQLRSPDGEIISSSLGKQRILDDAIIHPPMHDDEDHGYDGGDDSSDEAFDSDDDLSNEMTIDNHQRLDQIHAASYGSAKEDLLEDVLRNPPQAHQTNHITTKKRIANEMNQSDTESSMPVRKR